MFNINIFLLIFKDELIYQCHKISKLENDNIEELFVKKNIIIDENIITNGFLTNVLFKKDENKIINLYVTSVLGTCYYYLDLIKNR